MRQPQMSKEKSLQKIFYSNVEQMRFWSDKALNNHLIEKFEPPLHMVTYTGI